MDTELAEAYHQAVAATATDSTERKALMAERRTWLQERDVCKADASCWEEEYQSHIQTLW